MSPEAAKIFFVDNDPDEIGTTSEFLERAGHTVVDTASSLEEALGKIPHLTTLFADVVVLDGNLSEGDDSGADGARLAREIKSQHPDILVIGHAMRKPIRGADIDCPKIEGCEKLVDIITNA